MKNTKKIIATLATFTLTLSSVYAAADMATGSVAAPTTGTGIVTTQEAPVMATSKVESADFLDDKTMSLKLSQALGGIATDSEVKVLEDLAVVKATKDIDNGKKVKIELLSDIVDGASYSLVSVSEGLDSSIDFSLTGDKSKILNPDFSKDETSIEYISVVDGKNIEVYFNKDIATPAVEFKMFKELKVESMFLDTTNLNVKMFDALTSKKDYIAILSLKDLQNKDIEIENSLYDFTTPEFAAPQVEAQPEVTAAPLEGQLPPADLTASWAMTASGELAATGSGENIEAVAMNAAQTPDTGTKTNVLLFLTFMLSLAIFASKRKALKA